MSEVRAHLRKGRPVRRYVRRRLRVIRDASGWLIQADLPNSKYHAFEGPFNTKAEAEGAATEMRMADKRLDERYGRLPRA